MSSFRCIGLSAAPFAPLFDLDDTQLHAHGARRVHADQSPGFPCRVSLEDARPGEELLLLHYRHQPADTPYRAAGPIYVRRHAQTAATVPDQVPAAIRRRLLSLRGYDAADMLIAADVHAGETIAAAIVKAFADPQVRYLHLHHARQGCFACRVERVGLGTRDSGLGTRDSGLGTRDSGLGTRDSGRQGVVQGQIAVKRFDEKIAKFLETKAAFLQFKPCRFSAGGASALLQKSEDAAHSRPSPGPQSPVPN
ncbi:DUF1203 domain-containing protein [Xanthomonas theicola]|uniref:DUF1203 domain-containing protein n=1 Tax=Xanthomonas theicola TaxID=56464 RepID=UPI002013451A|nr:DUF1203 domain-containing protein [Xanthomonas theicola]